jgi:tetratricopeptide (TPR) repeat protein
VDLGKTLKELRHARGLTQRQLAEPEYTHAYVSTIEAGRKTPSRQVLECFAAKLRVDVEDLLTGRPPGFQAEFELRLREARIAASSGQIEQARKAYKSLERDADRYGLTVLRARAVEGLGLAAERSSRYEEAVEHYGRAEELLRDQVPTARADAMAGKARCLHSLGDLRYAVYLLESLLERIEREGLTDPSAIVRLKATLILPYFDLGLFRKAREVAQEVLQLAPRVDDPTRLGAMYVNVARVLLHQGHFKEAAESLIRAHDLYQQLDLQTEMGIASLALGYVMSREDRLDEALAQLELAHSTLDAIGSKTETAHTLNELARIHRLKGRPQEAIEHARRAAGLIADDGDVRALARAHRELGLGFEGSDPLEAEKHLRTALDLYERAEEPLETAVTYRVLGDLLQEQGDADGGSAAYRAGILALENTL